LENWSVHIEEGQGRTFTIILDISMLGLTYKPERKAKFLLRNQPHTDVGAAL
jgi:hypothetical protein